MFRGVGRRVGHCVAWLVLMATVAGASAHVASASIDNDATGKRWRALTETTGLTASQVATVCHRDGMTACSGAVGAKDLTGWVWATDAQVRTLFGEYAPAILTAVPPVLSSADLLMPAMNFLGEMGATFSFTGYNFHSTFASGWTSTKDAAGLPVVGSVDFGWYPILGSFALRSRADTASSQVGVWLWRPSGADITPPTITPAVAGTLGDERLVRLQHSVDLGGRATPSRPCRRESGCDPQDHRRRHRWRRRWRARRRPPAAPPTASVVVQRDADGTAGHLPVTGTRVPDLHGPARGSSPACRTPTSGPRRADRRGLRRRIERGNVQLDDHRLRSRRKSQHDDVPVQGRHPDVRRAGADDPRHRWERRHRRHERTRRDRRPGRCRHRARPRRQ